MNLPKINHKAFTDHESIKLKDFSEKLLCELEKLDIVIALAEAKLPTLPDETRGILLCLLPFIKNNTELNVSSRKEISQIQYDSPYIEPCQSTKTSKATGQDITVSDVVENSKTKTQIVTCDRLIITTDSIDQDEDAANDDRFQLNPKILKDYF